MESPDIRAAIFYLAKKGLKPSEVKEDVKSVCDTNRLHMLLSNIGTFSAGVDEYSRPTNNWTATERGYPQPY